MKLAKFLRTSILKEFEEHLRTSAFEINPPEYADLLTFTKEILDGNLMELQFLYNNCG